MTRRLPIPHVYQTTEREEASLETLDENMIQFLVVSFHYLDASTTPSSPATVSTCIDTTASGPD